MKNLILGLFFCLFPLFIACNAQKNIENSTQEKLSNFTDFSSIEQEVSPDNSSQEENFPQTEFWDVSDVDISKISPNRKLIALTFDDAPSKTLENIFAVYAAHNEAHPDCPAYATVFFNGKLFDNQTPHLLATAHALGFELGNHTYAHLDLTTLSKAQIREEIDRTDSLLFTHDGKERHLLRAPFGKVNDLVKTVAKAPIIDWTIDTLDWSGVCAEDIYQSVFLNRFSGAIALMHDGYPQTIDALKRLLDDLHQDGYQVVSVSQMAKMHRCSLRNGSVYIRARKQ